MGAKVSLQVNCVEIPSGLGDLEIWRFGESSSQSATILLGRGSANNYQLNYAVWLRMKQLDTRFETLHP